MLLLLLVLLVSLLLSSSATIYRVVASKTSSLRPFRIFLQKSSLCRPNEEEDARRLWDVEATTTTRVVCVVCVVVYCVVRGAKRRDIISTTT